MYVIEHRLECCKLRNCFNMNILHTNNFYHERFPNYGDYIMLSLEYEYHQKVVFCILYTNMLTIVKLLMYILH